MQFRSCFYLGVLLLCLGCTQKAPQEVNDLYPVKLYKKYGFINAKGEVVIEPKFFSVNWFGGNRAIVETAPGRKAMIDKKGNIIFQDTTGILHIEYQDGLVKFTTKDKQRCFLDSLGKTRFCLSDSILFAESTFSCERLLVRLPGVTFAYLDTNGKEMYRFKRGFPDNYEEEVARRSFNGRTCYFDKNGKRLFCVQGPGRNFNSERALIEQKGNVYFVDKKGNKKIKVPTHSHVASFNEGFAQVQKQGKNGFINTKGEEVIPMLYAQVAPFASGLVAVRRDTTNSKWIFLNERNEQVIPTAYDEVAMPGFRGELAYVRQESTWGYINKKGEWVWKASR